MKIVVPKVGDEVLCKIQTIDEGEQIKWFRVRDFFVLMGIIRVYLDGHPLDYLTLEDVLNDQGKLLKEYTTTLIEGSD